MKDKEYKSKSLEALGRIYNFGADADDKFYHNTKLLLKLYSKVLWRMSTTVMEMDEECYLTSGSGLYDVIDTLIDVDPRVEKSRLESRLESLENSKSILVLIDRAMLLLKNYPIEGQKYHDILTKTYMVFVKYSEIEIIEALNISRSTLYRDKKKAINLLGVILWGFVIPDLRKHNTN